MIKTKGANVIKILYHSLIYFPIHLFVHSFLSLSLSFSLPFSTLAPSAKVPFVSQVHATGNMITDTSLNFQPTASITGWIIRSDGSLIEWPWECSSSTNFRKSSQKSSLNVWSNLPVEPCGPNFIVGRFLFTVFHSVIVVGLFLLYISSWFSLGRLYLSRILSISSRLSISLAYSCLK